MSVSNNIVTDPVSIEEVRNLLQEDTSYRDLYTLCRSSKINPWARFKPTAGGRIEDRKVNSRTGNNEYYSVIYGMAKYDSQGTLVGRTDIIPNITKNNFDILNDLSWNLGTDWTSKAPNYYRLQDFNGYKHNAQFPMTATFMSNYSIGTQSGMFYNVNIPILSLRSLKISYGAIPVPNGSNSGPEKCWEDVSGFTASDYGQLFLEDLFAATSTEGLTTFQLGNFYLGVMFKIGNLYPILHTNVKINDILNASASGAKKLMAIVNGTENEKIKVGDIAYGNNQLDLNFRLLSFEDIHGYTFPTTNDIMYVDSRVVLIKELMSSNVSHASDEIIAYLYPGGSGNTGSVPANVIYSFEGKTGFCKIRRKQFKKLLSYVNITSKTNRSSSTHVQRNAGCFFTGDVRNVAGSSANVWYTYTNGNWIYDTSLGHPNSNFHGQCYLKLISEDTTVNGSGHWVKFQLKLQGFVCNEFRSNRDWNDSGNQALELARQYFFATTTEDVQKVVKLKLKQCTVMSNGIAPGTVKMQYPNTNAVLQTINFPSGGMDIDIYPDSSIFWWNATNVTSGSGNNTQFIYCTKQYGSETGKFKKCHSEMMHVDRLNYNGTDITTTHNKGVYIYVEKTAFSSQNYSDFYMYFTYSFENADGTEAEEKDVTWEGSLAKIYKQ